MRDDYTARMSQGTANKLHYADAEHQPRRRIIRKMATVLVLAGAVAVLVAWLPATIHNLKVMTLQRKCLEYSPGSDTVVLDTRPNSFPGLTRSDPELRSINLVQTTVLGRVPSIWPEFHRAIGASAFGGSGTLATAFLHRAQTPSGQERLVVINVYPEVLIPAYSYELWASVIELGSLRATPREKRFAAALSVSRTASDIVLFAGQPDSKRTDHFTIDAVIGGTSYVIDGYLRDDDTVSLDLILKSLTPRPPPSPASSP
jgi:hypothetical protein